MQVATDNLTAIARQAGVIDERAANAQPEVRAQLAKEFEGIFLSLLIKEMRKTGFEGEGLFQGDKSDIYGGLFDQFMAQHLVTGSGLGIAEMMNGQLASSSATEQP